MFRPAPFLVTLLDRAKAIVRRVARPRVEGPVSAAADTATGGPVPPVMQRLANGWMRSKLRALSALIRRVEAGERLNTPVRATLVAKGRDARVVRAAVPPPERLPRGFGWMCAFGPHVRGDGAAFAAWLSEPAMQARMLAAPVQMARVIGPILNATGERRSEWFPKRANVSRPARGQGDRIGLEIGSSSSDRLTGRSRPPRDGGDVAGADDCLIETTEPDTFAPAARVGARGAVARFFLRQPFERLADLPVTFQLATKAFAKMRPRRSSDRFAHNVAIS